MRARKKRSVVRLLSWILLAGGAFFLVSGAREFLLPILGQREISRVWKPAPATPAPPPRVSAPPAPPTPGSAVCRLVIPRLKTHFFVVEGTDRGDLRIGPGHMQGSALPGMDGNCIIAGHRDTHFRILKNIRKGDDIVLQTRTGEYHYRVRKTEVVPSWDNQPLRTTSEPVLSLVTCYPFYYVGPAPKRFVVRAELAGTRAGKAAAIKAPEVSPEAQPARTTAGLQPSSDPIVE
jgi:sortase A